MEGLCPCFVASKFPFDNGMCTPRNDTHGCRKLLQSYEPLIPDNIQTAGFPLITKNKKLAGQWEFFLADSYV